MFHVALLVSWAKPALCQSNQSAIIDMIAARSKAHGGNLRTFRAAYTIKNSQKRNEYFDGPKADMERTSKGTYVMDRTGGRFKYETEGFYAWHRTLKEWVPLPYTVGNDGKRHILLTGVNPDDKGRPSATLSDAKTTIQIGDSPRSFLSVVEEVPLSDYLRDKKGNITKARQIDDYRYEVTFELPMDEGDGKRRIEIIVDSREDWNITSETMYTPQGLLYYEKSVEFGRVNGVSFPMKGRIATYGADDPKNPDSLVSLDVDPRKVEVNVELSDAELQIDLPPGTSVFDKRLGVFWMVPELPSIKIALDDPAIAFASDKAIASPTTLPTQGQGGLREPGNIAAPKRDAIKADSALERSGDSHVAYEYFIPAAIIAALLAGFVVLRRFRARRGQS